MSSQRHCQPCSASSGMQRSAPRSYPAPSCYESLLENEAQVHVTGRCVTSRSSEPRVMPPAALHGLDEPFTQIGIGESDSTEMAVTRIGRSTTGSLPSAQTIVTMPSYCEMQRSTAQARVTIAPPSQTALKPCRVSSASVVSCAYSDTDSSTVGPTCRICDSTGDNTNRLISPCRCSGTSKFVHEQCLNVSTLVIDVMLHWCTCWQYVHLRDTLF